MSANEKLLIYSSKSIVIIASESAIATIQTTKTFFY